MGGYTYMKIGQINTEYQTTMDANMEKFVQLKNCPPMQQKRQARLDGIILLTVLGGRSKEIGHIVDAISGIAGQTNLLARNAAIEAAKQIANLVTQVADQVREISAAMQQMASGSQQIVSSVKEIEKFSKKTVGEAQTVSATTEEQSASVEEIAASSQALSLMAEELQAAVEKFKVQELLQDMKFGTDPE